MREELKEVRSEPGRYLGETASGRRNSTCKGPEVGVCPGVLQKQQGSQEGVSGGQRGRE